MTNFFKTHSQLLTAIALNLLAGALLGWLWWAHATLAIDLGILVAERATRRERSQQLSDLRRVVTETTSARQELARHFIGPETLPSLIEELERLGAQRQANLTLTGVTEINEAPQRLSLELNLLGAKANILAVLRDLDRLPYRLELRSGTLSQQPNQAGASSWSANFNLELLSYRPAPPPPKP